MADWQNPSFPRFGRLIRRSADILFVREYADYIYVELFARQICKFLSAPLSVPNRMRLSEGRYEITHAALRREKVNRIHFGIADKVVRNFATRCIFYRDTRLLIRFSSEPKHKLER